MDIDSIDKKRIRYIGSDPKYKGTQGFARVTLGRLDIFLEKPTDFGKMRVLNIPAVDVKVIPDTDFEFLRDLLQESRNSMQESRNSMQESLDFYAGKS